jgi:hypothetical protein
MPEEPVDLDLFQGSLKHFLTDSACRLQGLAFDPSREEPWRPDWQGKVRLGATSLFLGGRGQITVGTRFPADFKVGARIRSARLLCPDGDPEQGPYQLVRLAYAPPGLLLREARVLEVLHNGALLLDGRARGPGGRQMYPWTGEVR